MHATTVMLCIFCARYPDKMAWFQTKFLIFMVPREINSMLSANHLLQLILTIGDCKDRMFNNYCTSSLVFFKKILKGTI